MNIENIKEIMDNFSLAALFPEIESILDLVAPVARLCLMVGPFVLLALGLYYILSAPKEANYRSGYRCYFGMGSEMAWQFTQKLAGCLYALAGMTLVVTMALLGRKLVGAELMELLLQTVVYLFIQALVIVGVKLLINLTVAVRYNRKGDRRYTWAELWRG